MTTSTTTKEDVEVLVNNSKMESRLIAHKARDHSWASGYHKVLIQDRYGNGPFFMDWAPCADPDEFNPRDWNVLVRVQ
jgi:hypothetical protein